MFEQHEPKSDEISAAFLRILRSSIDDPDNALPSVVPDKAYRSTFLKLVRNLAPTGKAFERMEITSSLETKPVLIYASARQTISDSIRRQIPRIPDAAHQEITLQGVLRAVHLDKDWIEIVTSKDQHITINEVGETVDDVVGPLVNREVVIQAIKKSAARYALIDIQAAE